MSNDNDDTKRLIIAIVLILGIGIPGTLKLIEWIQYIGWIEFLIYVIISIGSVMVYKFFKIIKL